MSETSDLESIRVHTEHEGRLDQLGRDLAAHVAADTASLAKLEAGMASLLKYKTQIRAIVMAIAVVVSAVGFGAIFGGARWLLRQAVQDELIERGIVRIERSPLP